MRLVTFFLLLSPPSLDVSSRLSCCHFVLFSRTEVWSLLPFASVFHLIIFKPTRMTNTLMHLPIFHLLLQNSIGLSP